MRDFEEKRSPNSGNAGREVGQNQRLPNEDGNPTKEKGPVREPRKRDAQVLGDKNRPPLTSTDRAAHRERTSTVTDGEAG